jgi:hypothetical protein
VKSPAVKTRYRLFSPTIPYTDLCQRIFGFRKNAHSSDRIKAQVRNVEVIGETCENPSNACQTHGLGKRMDECNPLFQCCCWVCGCGGTSKGYLLGSTRRGRSRRNRSVRANYAPYWNAVRILENKRYRSSAPAMRMPTPPRTKSPLAIFTKSPATCVQTIATVRRNAHPRCLNQPIAVPTSVMLNAQKSGPR